MEIIQTVRHGDALENKAPAAIVHVRGPGFSPHFISSMCRDNPKLNLRNVEGVLKLVLYFSLIVAKLWVRSRERRDGRVANHTKGVRLSNHNLSMSWRLDGSKASFSSVTEVAPFCLQCLELPKTAGQ